ncbi:carbamoyl phosphate synthase small subunit [Spiroplasma tabanidicola]|uniref:Carbamoyl phosphate synthase small chain n=1 Tax=Spiroplasma tabanidicola TaxID=324079 RepID=A0A6I6C9B9_9MOLU|nr:carbamoyl phosphate synthase small subunit [Spiroplasma tabanidicola]QGS52049.1 carbamoyl-phosphate synthase small subunit [Spiroplasma tabanidicola]
MKRWLVLSDDTIIEGKALGANKDVIAELVFSTAMTGYQESITDQSFNNQIITFTYPLIGNYGINLEDNESLTPSCNGVVVKEFAINGSNFRNKISLDEFLKQKNISGICDVDTRMLTKKIRQHGVMKAAIVCDAKNIEKVKKELKNYNIPSNSVEQVSTKNKYYIYGGKWNILLIDYGLKISITKELIKRNCNVIVAPYNISTKEILEMNVDGILLSNGPGDPIVLTEQIEVIKNIIGKVPIFGICLGHQLLALANDFKTKKMKFGHRGINHPVKDLENNRSCITSQNHGYVVDENTIDFKKATITHRSLNDNEVEGISYNNLNAFSVQFHPDSCPGTSDSFYLFDKFISMIEKGKVK